MITLLNSIEKASELNRAYVNQVKFQQFKEQAMRMLHHKMPRLPHRQGPRLSYAAIRISANSSYYRFVIEECPSGYVLKYEEL